MFLPDFLATVSPTVRENSLLFPFYEILKNCNLDSNVGLNPAEPVPALD